jgi:hypothetical protein
MTGTADGLLGLANQLTTYYVFDKTRMRDNRFAAFIQNDWRVLLKLSLSLGLRYEALPTFQIQGNKQTNFDFATGRIPVPQESRDWVQSYLGLPGGNLPPGYQYIPGDQVRGENIGLDISPRIEFAYSVFGPRCAARGLRYLPHAAEHIERQQHAGRSVQLPGAAHRRYRHSHSDRQRLPQ